MLKKEMMETLYSQYAEVCMETAATSRCAQGQGHKESYIQRELGRTSHRLDK